MNFREKRHRIHPRQREKGAESNEAEGEKAIQEFAGRD